MALPARRIPESVAHLDIEIVSVALIRHDANIRNAARVLGVPSGDLRKLVLADQRLADAALEAVELRLDDAEANLSEALHCDDPRRRDAVSMFILRNTQRASKRGYAVAASAASLEVSQASDQASAQTVVFRWGGDDSDREMDVIEREGKKLSIPRYGGELGDCLEGALAESAVLIEHADTRGLEPAPGLEVEPAEEPSAIEASEPEALVSAPPAESAAARYEREQIDTWIRNRLVDYPFASCLRCRKPFVARAAWEEVSNGEARARVPSRLSWRMAG
jgi:hypothetical protein